MSDVHQSAEQYVIPQNFASTFFYKYPDFEEAAKVWWKFPSGRGHRLLECRIYMVYYEGSCIVCMHWVDEAGKDNYRYYIPCECGQLTVTYRKVYEAALAASDEEPRTRTFGDWYTIVMDGGCYEPAGPCEPFRNCRHRNVSKREKERGKRTISSLYRDPSGRIMRYLD